MKHFTINDENDITVHATREAASASEGIAFSTEADFASIAGDHKRMVEIWNGLTGVTPVKKFTSRNIAVTRIWRAIQNLGESATPKAPSKILTFVPKLSAEDAALDAAHLASYADRVPLLDAYADVDQVSAGQHLDDFGQDTSGAPQVADVAPTEQQPTETTSQPVDAPKAKEQRDTKTTAAITLMKRAQGATLAELMSTFGWQAHTVRGFVAGQLTKKMGIAVESFKPEGGERTYRIA